MLDFTLREVLVSLWQDSPKFRALVCIVLAAVAGAVACFTVGW